MGPRDSAKFEISDRENTTEPDTFDTVCVISCFCNRVCFYAQNVSKPRSGRARRGPAAWLRLSADCLGEVPDDAKDLCKSYNEFQMSMNHDMQILC